ncbi:MAG: MptD family putative ECF transporter S component [Johnsonella sp.]|nr:MptD family putative ECF transporter S component [Johnsonella sp.]
MMKNMNTAGKKLKGKDFIGIGIFGVIFLILFMLCIMIMSMSVYTLPFGVALGSFVGASVYMLLRSKTPKRGAIILFGSLFGLIMFGMGSGWPIFVSVFLGALIAELIRGGGEQSYFRETMGYAVLMIATAIGSYMPFLLMKEYYLKLAEGNGIDKEFMVRLVNFINGPYLAFALLLTFLMSISGALLAKKIFQKHLIKAGFIKEMK